MDCFVAALLAMTKFKAVVFVRFVSQITQPPYFYFKHFQSFTSIFPSFKISGSKISFCRRVIIPVISIVFPCVFLSSFSVSGSAITVYSFSFSVLIPIKVKGSFPYTRIIPLTVVILFFLNEQREIILTNIPAIRTKSFSFFILS